MTEELVPAVRRALVSVFDKTGLVPFATSLRRLGVELISTGGTATYLRDHGIPVTSVSEITNFPEILEGRVKTLHPAVHGAILARADQASHRDALAAQGIAPIELVAVNLYPFEAAVRESPGNMDVIVENIDIGGCALLRAAAKNYAFATVVTDPGDYDTVVAELDGRAGTTRFETRRALAAKAFARTAAYDAAIAAWFAQETGGTPPSRFAIAGELRQALRYGENPQQSAALYATGRDGGATIAGARQIQGKELSYNNLLDADAAFGLISEFRTGTPAAAIIKHANPCGAAVGATLAAAYDRAYACDPASAFGGIVALNGPLDETAARAILKIFTEVVIAPDASPAAVEIFARKPNIRLLLTGGLLDPNAQLLHFRSIAGGFLLQSADAGTEEAVMRAVTKRAPSDAERASLTFAMRVAKHVRSNAVVFARDGATIGIGAGQMSRIDSVRLAAAKARDAAQDGGRDPKAALSASVAASDAFFPFADSLIAIAEAGATAVIQPGGSIRDAEVIEAADARGLAMVFTGIRHFRH